MSGIIKAKDVITDAVDRAIALLTQHKRGDVIPWAEFERVGFVRDHTHWQAFNSRMRRTFRERSGINLMAVAGVGLKLLTLDEDVNLRSEKRRRRASRQLWRDTEELRAIPDKQLKGGLLEQKHRRIEHSRIARRKVLQAERVANTLTRKGDGGLYGKPRTTSV